MVRSALAAKIFTLAAQFFCSQLLQMCFVGRDHVSTHQFSVVEKNEAKSLLLRNSSCFRQRNCRRYCGTHRLAQAKMIIRFSHSFSSSFCIHRFISTFFVISFDAIDVEKNAISSKRNKIERRKNLLV